MTKTPNTRRAPLHAALLATLLGGCAPPGRPIVPRVAPPEAPILVEASNHRANPVAVYAIVDGSRLLLGDVSARATAVLRIPRFANQAWRLLVEARPIESKETFTSGPLEAAPGTVIELVVEPELSRSYATVRSPWTTPPDGATGGGPAT